MTAGELHKCGADYEWRGVQRDWWSLFEVNSRLY